MTPVVTYIVFRSYKGFVLYSLSVLHTKCSSIRFLQYIMSICWVKLCPEVFVTPIFIMESLMGKNTSNQNGIYKCLLKAFSYCCQEIFGLYFNPSFSWKVLFKNKWNLHSENSFSLSGEIPISKWDLKIPLGYEWVTSKYANVVEPEVFASCYLFKHNLWHSKS